MSILNWTYRHQLPRVLFCNVKIKKNSSIYPQINYISINQLAWNQINMELTPHEHSSAVSSLLSHYHLQHQQQQLHDASRSNEQSPQQDENSLGNHHHHQFLSKNKNKPHANDKQHGTSRDGSSPSSFQTVHRNYASSSFHPGNHQQSLHHLVDQQQIHGQHQNIPESNATPALQAQESSKFFMSSLLNLSSVSAQSSSESTIPYQNAGKKKLADIKTRI